MPLIDPQQSYTFSRYSDLKIDPIDLCQYFNYGYALSHLTLDCYPHKLTGLENLIHRITSIGTRLISRNEQAKREMFIAPIIEYVVDTADALIRIEYTVTVSPQLQGNLDYLLSTGNLVQLLVIEAKKDDLDYGFTQLLAELIALDQWERSPSIEQQPIFIGAITTGSIWQFARLDRQTKLAYQGINSFRSPEDLEMIVRILVQALRATSQPIHSQ